MIVFRSIRTKLTVWYAAWLAVALAGSGFTAYVVTRENLLDNLDRSLRSEVVWVNEFIEPKARKVRLKRSARLELQELKRTAVPPDAAEDTSGAEEAASVEMWNQIYQHTLLSPRRHYIQILDRNGDVLYLSQTLRNNPLQVDQIPYGAVEISTVTDSAGQSIRIAATQNDYVKILVGFPLEPLTEVLDSLFSNLRVISPLVFLISIVGGWFLAHQSLRPVDSLTRAARKITAQNLSQRLPTLAVDDEVGRLAEQFNDMIGRLQASFDQMQRFSADASHELRTPLTIMRGEIEVALRGRHLARKTRRLLNSIHDELVRLSAIVESLMLLVNSDSRRHVFSFNPIPLDAMVREVADDARMLAESKHIAVKVDRLDPVTVNGDAIRLRQLLLNLIDNAVKYTRPNGTVTMSLERSNGSALVRVQDTGVGIPRKDQRKVFERFYRVDRKDGIAVSGSGLGLSIARWIAEAHHGSLEVHSQENKGSTFIVKLPA